LLLLVMDTHTHTHTNTHTHTHTQAHTYADQTRPGSIRIHTSRPDMQIKIGMRMRRAGSRESKDNRTASTSLDCTICINN
jgi:hypothetical protein